MYSRCFCCHCLSNTRWSRLISIRWYTHKRWGLYIFITFIFNLQKTKTIVTQYISAIAIPHLCHFVLLHFHHIIHHLLIWFSLNSSGGDRFFRCNPSLAFRRWFTHLTCTRLKTNKNKTLQNTIRSIISNNKLSRKLLQFIVIIYERKMASTIIRRSNVNLTSVNGNCKEVKSVFIKNNSPQLPHSYSDQQIQYFDKATVAVAICNSERLWRWH